MISNEIEQYRERFKNSLVGKWIASEGSFALMSETYDFYTDGTGIWIQSSGSGDFTTYFDWKIEDPFVVQIRETKTVDSSTSEPEPEDGDGVWCRFEYEFRLASNDMSSHVVLCNKGAEHFYFSQLRISRSDNS